MRIKRSKRYKCVQGHDAEDFENKINSVLTEHPEADMTIDVQMPFLCHAWYPIEIKIPESKADEYELRGERHYCIECPYLERPEKANKRQKTFPCAHADYGLSRTDAQCCDEFYKWYEQKEVDR